MKEIIKACIIKELLGRIFHNNKVLSPPIKVKIRSINFLIDFASAKPPRKGAIIATEREARAVIYPQYAVPFSGATCVVKYTANIKVACNVGTGEHAQS